ncbi:hypothetical protein EUX98_g4170 [Antrodiella citrinella]|uniref:Uncharacterized protein n=1 Tax=Antrodiella citrinella TaxID=2447956 RepID=A0A4S4MVS1_9APHY|nr:hypothetical protein EUX98_g4170 [Antrodiella citrinella]
MTQQEGRVEVSMRTDSEEAEVNIDVAFGLDSMPELTDSDIEPDVVEGQAGVRADGPSVERSSGVHRDALLTPRQNFDFMQENTPPEMSITVELRPSVSGAVDERSSELATHNSTGEVESPRENPKLAEHSSLNASNIIDATRPSAGLALVTPTMHQELRDTTPIAGPSGYVTSSEHPFVQEPQVQAQALSGLEQTALTPNNDHTAHLTTSSGAQETNDNVSCRGTIQIPNSTPNSLSERCAALSGTNNAADEEQKLELVRPKGRSRKSADSRSATGTPDINMRWMSADLPESPAMNYYHSPPPSADAGTSSLTISVAGSSGILMNGAVAPSVCDRQGKPHAYVTQAGSCQVNPPNTVCPVSV